MGTVGILGQANAAPIDIPDIPSYHPTTSDALRFWSLREDNNVHAEVPRGFPARIDAPMVWQGSDMERQSEAWVVLLSEAEIIALEGAMHDFQSTVRKLDLPLLLRPYS